jgi:YggT family protein
MSYQRCTLDGRAWRPNVLGVVILSLLGRLLDLYSIVVLVAVVSSWMGLSHDHPVSRFTRTLVDPLLTPIKKVLPAMGGLDFSPMVLLFGIQILRRFLFRF